MMDTFKNFAQMSTDLFVKFNEQVAERMKDLKIDSKYSNELTGFAHHVKDKNDFYLEIAGFWNRVHKELDDDFSTNEKVTEAMREFQDESRKIYSRKSEGNESKSGEWLNGIEKISDEMAVRFLELGVKNSGRKKEAFTALVEYAEEFQKLESGKNSGDYDNFNKVWNTFQKSFLGLS